MEHTTLSTVEEIIELEESSDDQDMDISSCDIVTSSELLSNSEEESQHHQQQETYIRVKIDRGRNSNNIFDQELEELLLPVTVLSTNSTSNKICSENSHIYIEQQQNGKVFGEIIKLSDGPKYEPNSNHQIANFTNNNNTTNGSTSSIKVSTNNPVSSSFINSLRKNSQSILLSVDQPTQSQTTTEWFGKEEDDDDDEFEDEQEFDNCKFGKGVTTTLEEPRRHRIKTVMFPVPAILKRASLSLEEKMDIIKDLSNGAKQSLVCKSKRLPKSTVQSIWKNRQKIQDAVKKVGSSRKRCRKAQHEDIEQKLLEWIETLKSQGINVNGPQLRAKAQVFSKQLGITEFRSSTGWLDKFKTRHSIVFKKPNSQGTSLGDKKIALDWVTKTWPNLCEGFDPENIFSCDEFGIFYKALPSETNKLTSETCHSGKLAEERLSILVCTNSDGSEKRKLVIVGNSKLNSATNINNLPVKYHQDSKSWITKNMFVNELRDWDAELRTNLRNIIVILDNSPAHTITETFSNIKLVFLPPSVSVLLQPLQHGIVQDIKSQYRRLFLDHITRKTEERKEQQQNTTTIMNNNSNNNNNNNRLSSSSSTGNTSNSCTISLMESLLMLDCAWVEVKQEKIEECFKNSNLQSVAILPINPIQNNSTNTNNTNNGSVNGNNNNNNLKTTFEQSDAIFDLELMEKASFAGIKIPPSLTFANYVNTDTNLQVTDMINEQECLNTMTLHASSSSDSSSSSLNVKYPNVVDSDNISCKRDIQNYLEAIRTWVTSLQQNIEPSVHHSLSLLGNLALRQSVPEYQPCYINESELIMDNNESNNIIMDNDLSSNEMNESTSIILNEIQNGDNMESSNDHEDSSIENGNNNNNNNTTSTTDDDNSLLSSTHGTTITFAISDSLNNNVNIMNNTIQAHAQLPHQHHFFAYLS